LKGCLHPFKGSGATVGYHKKGYPNQNNKNRKRQSKPSAITRAQGAGLGSPNPLASGASRDSPNPLASGASHGSPDPLASGASSASPDPSWARASTPPRPSPRLRARLPTHGTRTHYVTDAVTAILWQGTVVTIPTTPATIALPLSLCYLTSFTVV